MTQSVRARIAAHAKRKADNAAASDALDAYRVQGEDSSSSSSPFASPVCPPVRPRTLRNSLIELSDDDGHEGDEHLLTPTAERTAEDPAHNVVIEDFLCPITQSIMSDPVTDANGHSYEKAAIEEWLSNHNTSPVTGALLSHKNLVPNHSLRNAIINSTTAPAAKSTTALRDASSSITSLSKDSIKQNCSFNCIVMVMCSHIVYY